MKTQKLTIHNHTVRKGKKINSKMEAVEDKHVVCGLIFLTSDVRNLVESKL